VWCWLGLLRGPRKAVREERNSRVGKGGRGVMYDANGAGDSAEAWVGGSAQNLEMVSEMVPKAHVYGA
jgi:hypothetical protein